MMYDLAIIGGGPAGVAAGVYAARKRLKTIFITKDFDGQSAVSLDIQNWIGTVAITGADLSKNLESHLRAYAGDVVDIKKGEYVKKIEKNGDSEKISFIITTDKNSYATRAILITSGSRRKKLEVPGAQEFDNKGLTYCASCDGPLFAGMDVVVVGGGNAAFDTAAQLLAYCTSVTLLARTDFKADPATVQKTLENPKFKAIKNTEIVKVSGDKFVNGITYKNKDTGEIVDLPIGGIFAEIGSLPNTDFVKDLLKLDQFNHIIVDPRTQRTSVEGIWAAGDSTDGLYHQNNIAAGDAVKALEDLYLHLHLKK
jgi:alkyl hydroperoxide reductase subunit F